MSMHFGLIDPWRQFDEATALRVETLYKTKVDPDKGTGGGCMWAIYDGVLTGLYGEVFARTIRPEVYKTARKRGRETSVDLIMELMVQKGKAGDPWTFDWRKGRYRCESPQRYKDLSVEEALNASVKVLAPGWYFFGLSVSGGMHSVSLALERKTSGNRILWLDQFTSRFDRARRRAAWTNTPDVTHRLDQTMVKLGKADSRVWPFYK